jgi:hypothetical protein
VERAFYLTGLGVLGPTTTCDDDLACVESFADVLLLLMSTLVRVSLVLKGGSECSSLHCFYHDLASQLLHEIRYFSADVHLLDLSDHPST